MPDRWPLLAALFTATFVLLMVWQGALRRLQAQAADRPRLPVDVPAPATAEDELRRPFRQRVLQPLMIASGEAIGRLMPRRVAQRTGERLRAAGGTMVYAQFLAVKVLVAAMLAVALFGVVLPLRPAADRLRLIVPLALICLLAFSLPDYLLGRRISERRQLYEHQLPDAMDLLCISVEAGLGFDAAIQRVAEKFADPIAGELRAYLAETRLGRPRAEALRNLANRSGVPDMRSFTGAVIQAEQLGVSLARVLRSQADSIRVRRRQRMQELAAQVPVKMLFPMVIFILPCIFIVILGPALIQIAAMFTGIIGP